MTKQQTNKEEWEKEFFNRLSEKLEEIFPKTNQNNPEVPSEGNRSGALSFNAFANIIFRDVLEKALLSREKAVEERVLKAVKEILEDEIATAHTSESGKTSRLTSAYNRVIVLKPNNPC